MNQEKRAERRRKRDVERYQRTGNRRNIDRTAASGRAFEGRPVRNREFAVVTYLFLGIFLAMIGYFVYFQTQKSEEFINSPYNARQDAFADRIKRGDILSADGEVLATTKASEDGTETREYPYSRAFAHVIGYSTNGKAGVESLSNFELLRSHAFFLEKIIKEIRDEKNIGDTVITTLDSRVQTAAYNALGSAQGAVVAIQPSTGKLICMVSKPDYDPNTIAANWESITSKDNTDSVLLNRATQGLYPPGSTFKLVTLLEYMREHKNYEDYSFSCEGSLERDGNVIHCFGNEVHGTVSLKGSLAKSCNTSFANLGLTLKLKNYSALCDQLLFNSSLPCEFHYKQSNFSLGTDAATGEIMQTAIGQGQTLVTPYHLALIMSAIDNEGVLMRPYVIDRVTNYGGTEVKSNEPQEYGALLSTSEASVLKDYMRSVVTEGTATRLNVSDYTAGGKTGSAEYTSAKDSHAWFVGYAAKEGQEDLVVAVVVEGAGTGGTYAVPVAKAVFDAYYR